MTRSSIPSWMIDGMPDEIWFHSNPRVCGASVGALLLTSSHRSAKCWELRVTPERTKYPVSLTLVRIADSHDLHR